MKKNWILLQKRTRCFKNCFQKVVHKAAEAIREVIGKKTIRKLLNRKQNCEIKTFAC